MMSKKKKNTETPFTPRAMDLLIKEKKYAQGYQMLMEGAKTYFLRFQQALNPYPTDDTALLIHLYRHMADELERQDPKAKELAAQFKQHLKLPPVEIERRPK